MKSEARYVTTADVVKREAKQSRLSKTSFKTQPNHPILLATNVKRYPQTKNKNYPQEMSSRIKKMLTTCTDADTQHNWTYTQEDDHQKDDEYQFTKQYLTEIQKARSFKDSLYTSFRHKLVAKFPNMKKVYPYQQFQSGDVLPLQSRISKKNQGELHGTQNQNDFKRSSLGVTHQISSTIGLSKNSKELDTVNRHNRNIMKQIYKICYFYSKSKKCCISTHYKSQSEEYVPPPEPKPAKFNYISFKRQKKSFKRGSCKTKGANLISSQNDILSLQKQGTKAYNLLKKCYDDAIENALSPK